MSFINKLYKKESDKLQKKKLKIVKDAEKNIAGIYTTLSEDMKDEIDKIDATKYSELDLHRLKKSTKTKLKEAQREIKNIIDSSINKMIVATTASHMTFLNKVDKRFGTTLSNVFKGEKGLIEDLIRGKSGNGEIYKDKKKLSDRLWIDLKQNQKTIDAIINQGIKNKEHPLDIAKKLEQFVNPNRKKDFDYSIIYPHSKRKVEYNALRHARTQINHAQHQAIIETAKKDKLVSEIEWMSAHSHRSCPLCADRDGQRYSLNKVPVDHPNGMCQILIVYPDDDKMDALIESYLESDYDDFDDFLDTI